MHSEIIDILKGIRPDIDYEKENHLLTQEILDSFDVISILAALSEKFQIDIDPDNVNEQYFDSIEGMEQLILFSKKSKEC